MVMETPMISNRFAVVVVVWLKVRVSVPVPLSSAPLLDAESTATCAREYDAASIASNKPRIASRVGAPLRVGGDRTRDALACEGGRKPAARRSLLVADCPIAAPRKNIPPTPFRFTRMRLRPRRTSFATATPRICALRTGGSFCWPQSPRVMKTSLTASAFTSRCSLKP